MTMIPIKMTSDGGLSVINHAPTVAATLYIYNKVKTTNADSLAEVRETSKHNGC